MHMQDFVSIVADPCVTQLISPVCMVVVSMLLPCVAEELLSHIGAHWLVIAIKLRMFHMYFISTQC